MPSRVKYCMKCRVDYVVASRSSPHSIVLPSVCVKKKSISHLRFLSAMEWWKRIIIIHSRQMGHSLGGYHALRLAAGMCGWVCYVLAMTLYALLLVWGCLSLLLVSACSNFVSILITPYWSLFYLLLLRFILLAGLSRCTPCCWVSAFCNFECILVDAVAISVHIFSLVFQCCVARVFLCCMCMCVDKYI